MKILALEQDMPGVTAADFTSELNRAEAYRVWELLQADVLREIYFRRDRTSAVLVLECASVEEAQAVLASLPLVRVGLITFEIIPLAPYPGLSRLFTGVT
ncbi:MAG: superoxide dismutase [Anaerolineae bacterium]|jgi:muconolactone delta-isomerase|nr:superoxide dismutase [Anaerolineae bacterium]